MIGRLSCSAPKISDGCLDASENIVAAPIDSTYLVSKATHASADRLLNDVQAVTVIRRALV